MQAQKFGAEITIPAEAENLDCRRADGVFGLALKRRMRPRLLDCYRDRSALSASRRFRPSTLRRMGSLVLGFTDRSQALREPGCNRCRRRQFLRAGGGVPLHHVGQGPDDGAWRRAGKTISQYLIDRIAAAPNIILHNRTELVAHGLERVGSREHGRGVDEEAHIRNVFCFTGADPAKTWLSDCGVDLDAAGFVVTGAGPDRIPLRTSVPGIIRGRGRPIRVGQARR